jgi:transcriptional regulator with XRE-family HTH domain
MLHSVTNEKSPTKDVRFDVVTMGSRILEAVETYQAENPKVTKKQICDALGISTTSLDNYSSGTREMPAGALARLALLAEFNPSWLLLDIGQRRLVDYRRSKQEIMAMLSAELNTLINDLHQNT